VLLSHRLEEGARRYPDFAKPSAAADRFGANTVNEA
jgi:hypothetical protein